MDVVTLVEKIQTLPYEQQLQVLYFVDALPRQKEHQQPDAPGNWSRHEFASFSLGQAMRGLDQEDDLYAMEDIKEHWR